MSIRVSYEGKRGCGYRKPGGLYLVSPGSGRPCGLLPIPLVSCPTCGHGIKFSRGWTWVNIAELAAIAKTGCKMENCGNCPLADAKIQRAGLLWIGSQFYKTPLHWAQEAEQMGISRRIKSVPKGFVIGETWVALAHIAAIYETTEFKLEGEPAKAVQRVPGIFRLFQPVAVEYVVKGTESEKELEDLAKRGITPVEVRKAEEQRAA